MSIIKIERNGYEFQYCPEHPTWRFKGASKPKAPKPLAPVATPVQIDEEVRQKDRDKRRQRLLAAGRQGTILAGGLAREGGNATILGRSTS